MFPQPRPLGDLFSELCCGSVWCSGFVRWNRYEGAGGGLLGSLLKGRSGLIRLGGQEEQFLSQYLAPG